MFREDSPALELRGLTKRYDDGTLALEDFDLEIPAGAFFGLLGPNGAGKTTLISAVCNLLRITRGEIRVFGEPHHSLAARSLGRAGRAGHQPRPLPDRARDARLPRRLLRDGSDPDERAEEMIDAFGLEPSATRARRSSPAASAGACCWPARSCTARAS